MRRDQLRTTQTQDGRKVASRPAPPMTTVADPRGAGRRTRQLRRRRQRPPRLGPQPDHRRRRCARILSQMLGVEYPVSDS